MPISIIQSLPTSAFHCNSTSYRTAGPKKARKYTFDPATLAPDVAETGNSQRSNEVGRRLASPAGDGSIASNRLII